MHYEAENPEFRSYDTVLAWLIVTNININRFDILSKSPNYVSINKPNGQWKNLVYLEPREEDRS